MRRAAALSALLLGACASDAGIGTIATYQPATGSNEVLRGEITAAPGHELVMGDLVLPAGAEVPRHYHYGEEFLYVFGGSVTLYRPGLPDAVLSSGESILIAPGAVHWAKAGPEGVRAVASWIAEDGKPLREPVSGD